MPASNNKSSKKGLGRGFSSLIPTDLLDESFDPTADQDRQVSDLRQIKISQITTDPNQPRKYFDQEELTELASSISEHGVLQPIIVMPKGDGYQIVAGERRYHASKMAGLDKIPALVRTLSEQHKLEISLIENLQRQDLNVIETATAYLKLRNQFNMPVEEIGKRVGNSSVSAVSNKLRLLKLPQEVQQLLANGKLTEGQARPLIGLDEEIIRFVVPKILRESWTTKKIEQFVVDLKKNQQSGKKISDESQMMEQPYAPQIENMQKRLRADVSVRINSRGAGKITIKFRNEREFNRIQGLLGDN